MGNGHPRASSHGSRALAPLWRASPIVSPADAFSLARATPLQRGRCPRPDGRQMRGAAGCERGSGTRRSWTGLRRRTGASVVARHRVIIEGDPASPTAIYYWDHSSRPVKIWP